MNLLEQHGTILGGALLVVVVVCALLLGRKASKNVREFRDEHHESFLGTRKK